MPTIVTFKQFILACIAFPENIADMFEDDTSEEVRSQVYMFADAG